MARLNKIIFMYKLNQFINNTVYIILAEIPVIDWVQKEPSKIVL